MKDINGEIEQMATKLEKSTMTPKETLFKAIESLSKAELKARVELLSEEEKTILKSAIQEINLNKAKSVEFDKEAQSAKVIQGNIMDTVLQEEIGSDDADEKLVKPEANKHSHQGNSVDGWEGQVIKGKMPMEKKTTKSEEKEQKEETDKVEITEDNAQGKKMKKSSEELLEQVKKSEDLTFALIDKMWDRGLRKSIILEKCMKMGMEKSKVEGALKKVKDMKKGMDKKEAAEKIMAMEEKEHGTKNPKKLVESEKKEHAEKKMKKSESEHDSGHILAEEDQLGDTAQMAEDKKKLKDDDNLHTGEDNKKAQDEVNNVKRIEKSLSWTSDADLLKAGTQGRNFHFNVGDFVDQMLKADKDMSARKEMDDEREGNEEKEEKLKEEGKKKESKNMMVKKSEDLNDIIAKSMDTTWFQEDIKKSLEEAKSKVTGKLVKSYEDSDIAAALGLSEEEAKKILG